MVQIKVGVYTFEMKKFKIVNGHDDSLPFNGKLYVNNRYVADCYNDGWGGEAVVTPIQANIALFEKVEKYIKHKILDGFKATIPYIADSLACKKADEMELLKLQVKGIIFRKPNGFYCSVPINDNKGKAMPIKKVMETYSGKNFVHSIIDKYTKMGYVCVNTNI